MIDRGAKHFNESAEAGKFGLPAGPAVSRLRKPGVERVLVVPIGDGNGRGITSLVNINGPIPMPRTVRRGETLGDPTERPRKGGGRTWVLGAEFRHAPLFPRRPVAGDECRVRRLVIVRPPPMT